MMRLNKFLSQTGVASRRKADELIEQGKIRINGKIIKELGSRIDEKKDKIEYLGKIITIQQDKIYIALNKPKGYISSTTNRQGNSVLDLLPKGMKVYPVGRLDKDSRGLMILTNDGDLAYELTQASHEHEKEYEVSLNKKFVHAHKANLEKGMDIDGKHARGIGVKVKSEKSLLLTLKQGLNRQIRKMLGKLGYEVTDLKRIRINKLKLDGLKLKEGEWKNIKISDII